LSYRCALASRGRDERRSAGKTLLGSSNKIKDWGRESNPSAHPSGLAVCNPRGGQQPAKLLCYKHDEDHQGPAYEKVRSASTPVM